MSVCLLGKKIGMTQVFDKAGKQVPVTVVKVEPTYVVQKKLLESDGYIALQLGAFQVKRCNKPQGGHFKKVNMLPLKVLREIRTEKIDTIDVGDRIAVDMFTPGDFVDITAQSIGKGFQGVIKRHGYAGGPSAHGSTFHRRPGSVGSQAGGKSCRKKVPKGRPLPGHMGDERITVHNVEVISVDNENQILVLKGSIPGGGNNLVIITNSFKKSPQIEWKVIKPAPQQTEEVPAVVVAEDAAINDEVKADEKLENSEQE